MQAFPEIDGCQVPLCEQTALALTELLVVPTLDAARLTIAGDPALAVWIAASGPFDTPAVPSIDALAAWLTEQLPWVLASAEGSASFDDEETYAVLAGEALLAAELGEHLCDDRDFVSQARVLALTHGWSQWFHPTAPPRPAWLASGEGSTGNGAASAATAFQQACRIVSGEQPPPSDVGPLSQRRKQLAEQWRQPPARGPAVWQQLAEAICEHQELQQRFAEKLEEEKLEAMAEFAAGAGHEINNPVANISGRAQLLLRSETDPQRRRDLANMNWQAVRVHEMISDAMLFARPPQPRRESVALSQLLPKAVQSLEAKAEARKIALRCSVAENLPSLTADPDQLQVVFKALIENALEAIGERGQVEIQARRTDATGLECLRCRPGKAVPDEPAEAIEILVRDDGPGISPEVRRHLFDPFYSGRQAGRGLGFGLAKSWRIVRNHGGKIEVESEPGRGATFRLLLPLAPFPTKAFPERPREDSSTIGR